MSVLSCRLGAAALAFCVVAAALTAEAAAVTRSYSTQQQVDAGQQVYAQNCAKCHKSSLEGGAGPALKGPDFASNLQFSQLTGQKLFDFISKQMPLNKPGKLTEQQYLQVYSYILSQNGFPTGSQELTKDKLGQVQLLPLPGGNSQAQSNSG